MDSLAYYLLPETWQRFLSHSWATFGLREEAVETLSMAWRWSSVSLDLYLDLLKFKVEKSFSHKYVLPKRHMVRLNIRESSGKLGFNSRKKKLPKLVFFSTHLPELGFEDRVALQVNELHLKHRRGILHIKGEGIRKNLKSVSVRLEVCKSVIKFLL